MKIREIPGKWYSKIYLGKFPEQWVDYQTGEILEHRLPMNADPLIIQESRCAGLIYKHITSSAGFYGALGAELKPDAQANQLKIQVHVSTHDSDQAHRFVIPADYAQIVLDEAISLLGEHNFLGIGDLTFNRGAYHLIDSSPFVFRVLARTVTQLLDPKLENASDEEIQQVLEDAIKSVQNRKKI